MHVYSSCVPLLLDLDFHFPSPPLPSDLSGLPYLRHSEEENSFALVLVPLVAAGSHFAGFAGTGPNLECLGFDPAGSLRVKVRLGGEIEVLQVEFLYAVARDLGTRLHARAHGMCRSLPSWWLGASCYRTLILLPISWRNVPLCGLYMLCLLLLDLQLIRSSDLFYKCCKSVGGSLPNLVSNVAQ